jgi:subtilisin family serine protease
MHMKSPLYRGLLAVLLAAACAPAGTVAGPAAQPTTRPAVEAPAAAPATGAALTAAPHQWWLLDAAVDRVHGTSVERAYAELLAGRQPGRTVVVAIIDSGVDARHEDLRDVMWVNPREVAGSGRDDAGNGYVDDVHGWNFIGGPDGRNVHHDTYEVTRLYAAARSRFEGARQDTMSAATRAAYDEYRALQAEFEAKRAEAREQLQQIRQIDAAVDHFWAMLRQHLGTDSLTAEAVRGIQTTRPDLRQARQAFLQLAESGITQAMVKRQREHVEGRVEYGFNPDFDPRPIVGDDYADPTERFYGNRDVRGPSADHGTHVAGIVAARRGNQLGIDGMADAVRIMAIRAVPDGDERDKDVANAIRYAVDNGAQIINMSFGKSHSPYKRVVDEAVRYADERGVLMIHAAGNEGTDLDANPNFPTRRYADGGMARHWIEVGASAWWGVDSIAAPFSNYGQTTVDVFAPGVAILSAYPDDRYEQNDGTSMAAPVVSGLAALLMAYYPALSAEEVRQIILDSATRFPGQLVNRPGGEGERVPFSSLSVTGGVVNAYRAVQMAEERTRAARE